MPRQPAAAQHAPVQPDPVQLETVQPDPVTVEVPAPRDSRPVLALRVTAYVLTSLASLVFLALVVYGYLSVQDIKQRLASTPMFGGTPSYSAPVIPGSTPVVPSGDGVVPSGDAAVPGANPGTGDQFATVCRDNPSAPECNGTSGG